MNEKKKKLMVVGGVALAGLYFLSRKGDEGFAGGIGNTIAKPLDMLNIPTGDDYADTEPTPAETITDILAGLPPIPAFTGGGGMGGGGMGRGGIPQMPEESPISIGGGTKKGMGFSMPSFEGLGTTLIGASLKAPAFLVMKPTQMLGGAAARVSTGTYDLFATKKQERAHRSAQARRVRRYPRSSHAVSMLTGGATARAPVTKKQYAARKKYPNIYKVWKSAFSWLGA